MCKAAYFKLFDISQIRTTLTQKSADSLVLSLVISRLDYGNCLLYGVPDYLIHRLQLVQNAAARVVCRTKTRRNITPILQPLHWLPVKHRIDYNIAVLVCTTLHF